MRPQPMAAYLGCVVCLVLWQTTRQRLSSMSDSLETELGQSSVPR